MIFLANAGAAMAASSGSKKTPLSSSGLGYLVLIQETGVRLPLGVMKTLHRSESLVFPV